MNSISWEVARRSLIDQGVNDFSDGDIIREHHRLTELEAKKADALQKEQLSLLDPVKDVESVTVTVNYSKKKSFWGSSVA